MTKLRPIFVMGFLLHNKIPSLRGFVTERQMNEISEK